MRERFLNLPIQTQTAFSTMPIYVPLTLNPDDETDKQIFDRQEKFLRLRKDIRWKLASFDIGDKIESIGHKYSFELLRLANITRLIREYYFGEVGSENFPKEIEKRMGVSLLTAQEITRYIKQEIIDWDPYAEYIARLPKMTVREILANHPKIAGLEITSGYIEPRNPEEELEEPTIKNWLRDYVLHLGQENHSPMARMQYLFHSRNGKNLNSSDRDKLGAILKSFDENTPLPVDIENNEIVFESVSSESAPPADSQRSMTNSQRPTNIPKSQPAPAKQEPFIRPYTSRPQTQTPPVPRPVPKPSIPPQPQPPKPSSPEIDKFFESSEESGLPPIKVRGFTEHGAPQNTVQRNIIRPHQMQAEDRPKHKIIDPFSSPMPEPRLDGNVVDLSMNNDQ